MTTVTLHKHAVVDEYICERDYMTAATISALGVKPPTCAVKKPPRQENKDCQVKVENQLDNVCVDGWVNESWADSKYGQMSQIEGFVTNRTGGQLRRLRLEFEPKDCVADLWNLQKVAEGVYELAYYWLDDDWMGGVAPDVTLFWGGIFRGKDVKMTFTHNTAS